MYLAQFEFIFILIFHFNITSDTILIFSSEMRNIKYAMIKCSNRVEAKKKKNSNKQYELYYEKYEEFFFPFFFIFIFFFFSFLTKRVIQP